jgi:hypothetical protein
MSRTELLLFEAIYTELPKSSEVEYNEQRSYTKENSNERERQMWNYFLLSYNPGQSIYNSLSRLVLWTYISLCVHKPTRNSALLSPQVMTTFTSLDLIVFSLC